MSIPAQFPPTKQNLIYKALRSHRLICGAVQDAHGSDHSVASMLRNASTLGDSVLLIAALCFHSVFEGIAIGVAGKAKLDRDSGIWMDASLLCSLLPACR